MSSRGAFVAGHLGGPNEPWSYGPDAERVLTAQIALRERLRPYLEMLMAEASATGLHQVARPIRARRKSRARASSRMPPPSWPLNSQTSISRSP